MSLEFALNDLTSKIDTETHIGKWLTMTQERINQFAITTLDDQWIHIDEEMAAKHSPFGGTIAHGFLTLSLITHLTDSVNTDKPRYPDIKMGVNYGLNKVRFPNPVRVGDKIRARTTLMSVEEVKGNGVQIVNQVTVDIEGQQKPACVAQTVSRLYF